MQSLAAFQDAFAQALVTPAGDPIDTGLAAMASQPGFAVYRNTVTKGWIDALQANYPAVARLVGEEWMRAAAQRYAKTQPPRDARMLVYGETFPDFLAGFEPARELPYLAGVAQLDRCWSEAHVAADADPLDGARLAALAPDALARARLELHPATRWRWSDDAPIASLWIRSRDGDGDLSDIAWCAEGLLITRPGEHVRHIAIDRATCAFLDACAEGGTLSACVMRAIDADAQANFTRMMALLVEAGAFRTLHSSDEE